MLRYQQSFPLIDKDGKDTLWETVIYDQSEMEEIFFGLKKIYCDLKTTGDISLMKNIRVQKIDYCTFGNSNPFRIKIVNTINDNHDYYYVKNCDASRLYGLELEDILSPNRIVFITNAKDTLIEEHIAGIPGDVYIKDYLKSGNTNTIRLAKEFVKFNERCFIRLLGDMRSYNYVVIVTQDFDGEQYRVRAIDFDQQSYEGKMNLYKPGFFKENSDIVKLCMNVIDSETLRQYQYEERTLIFRRISNSKYKIKTLVDSMQEATLSTPEKIYRLKYELSNHHKSRKFLRCNTMGDLVKENFKFLLKKVKPS